MFKLQIIVYCALNLMYQVCPKRCFNSCEKIVCVLEVKGFLLFESILLLCSCNLKKNDR